MEGHNQTPALTSTSDVDKLVSGDKATSASTESIVTHMADPETSIDVDDTVMSASNIAVVIPVSAASTASDDPVTHITDLGPPINNNVITIIPAGYVTTGTPASAAALTTGTPFNAAVALSDGSNAHTDESGTPVNNGATVTPASNEVAGTPAISAPANRPDDRMKIVVQGQDGTELVLAVKPSTRMGKIQLEYANRAGRDLATLRFHFDGQRVAPDDTVTSVRHSLSRTP
jgi:hypothetical protein